VCYATRVRATVWGRRTFPPPPVDPGGWFLRRGRTRNPPGVPARVATGLLARFDSYAMMLLNEDNPCSLSAVRVNGERKPLETPLAAGSSR